jgi:hypothetical protein
VEAALSHNEARHLEVPLRQASGHCLEEPKCQWRIGFFSRLLDAKKKARRDGVPPIELVDGEALVEMLEQHELGLVPRRSYDIDEMFFQEYKN